MKRAVLILFLVVFQLFARDVNSLYTMKADGTILALLISDGKIYASTDSGVVDVFDQKSHKKESVIEFDKIKDFFGEMSDTRIFSVDKYDKSLLFVSQGEEGFSRVYLNSDGKNQLIFDKKDKLSIVKAKFISKDKIILALLSSQVLVYDLKKKKFVYNVQVSGSKFSDFALNEDKSRMVLVDESGSATLVSTKDGKVIRVFKGQNLDNVYQVDYKNHTIAIASKDRRCGVYIDDGSLSYYKSADFMVYSVGISLDGKLCAYPSDFVNNITIFDVNTKENVYRLVGDKSTISNIIFVGESEIYTSSKNKIKFWRIK